MLRRTARIALALAPVLLVLGYAVALRTASAQEGLDERLVHALSRVSVGEAGFHAHETGDAAAISHLLLRRAERLEIAPLAMVRAYSGRHLHRTDRRRWIAGLRLDGNKAPLRAHELMLVFGAAAYDPQFTEGHPPMHEATRRSSSALYGRNCVTKTKAGTTRRYATSVIPASVVNNDADIRIHSCQKPVELLRWLVRAYSRPGDLVADPTCGSGAAIQAARAEGRQAIGWELDSAAADRAQRWLDGRDLPLFEEAAHG